jgi:hypothetical protein
MVFVQWRRMRMCKQYEKLLLIKLNKYDLLWIPFHYFQFQSIKLFLFY